jgi:hypothetical protein
MPTATDDLYARALGNSERFFSLCHPQCAFPPCQNVSLDGAPPREELVALLRAAVALEMEHVCAARCVVIPPDPATPGDLGLIRDTGARGADAAAALVTACPDAVRGDWLADLEALAAGRGMEEGSDPRAPQTPFHISVGDGWLNARFNHAVFDGSSIPAVLDRLLKSVAALMAAGTDGTVAAAATSTTSTPTATTAAATTATTTTGPAHAHAAAAAAAAAVATREYEALAVKTPWLRDSMSDTMENLLRRAVGDAAIDAIAQPQLPLGSPALSALLSARDRDGATCPAEAWRHPLRRTRLAVRAVPAETMARILTVCRSHGTTLHGLLSASLARAVRRVLDLDDAGMYHNVSLRRECGVEPDTPGVFVKGVFSTACAPPDQAPDGPLWAHACALRDEIKAAVEAGFHRVSEEPTAFFLTCVAPDARFAIAGETRGRLQTMHVSNRGRVPIRGEYAAAAGAVALRVTATHSFSPIAWSGPLVSLNVMTTTDGRLHITLSSIVITDAEREAIVAAVVDDLVNAAKES